MIKFSEFAALPEIQILGILIDGQPEALVEGLWVDGRYDRNIRIDRDTHFSDTGDLGRHAHIYGRTDRAKALVAVRQNGDASHGLKGCLHKDDAAALRQRGFDIPQSNIIEWLELPAEPDVMLLLEHLETLR